jgi:tripartite-type tricarboxylate transporter receptor subunit TctC
LSFDAGRTSRPTIFFGSRHVQITTFVRARSFLRLFRLLHFRGAEVRVPQLIAVIWLALAGAIVPAHAEKRIALVVGIDRYDNLPPHEQLQKAVNDSRAVGRALTSLGFEVMSGENAGRQALVDKLDAFAQRLSQGDVAFFFFSGHGVALGGVNYILPSDIPDIEANQEIRLARAALNEHDIVSDLQGRGVRVAVVVLDACRTNPFVRTGSKGAGGERGLAPPPQVKGVFSIYAASAGQAARDRLSESDRNPNSVFSRVLVPALTKPGLDLTALAFDVREEVARVAQSAGYVQEPSYYDGTIGGRVYLAGLPPPGSNGGVPGTTGVPPASLPVTGLAPDETTWSYLKDTRDAEQLRRFIREYPSSPHRRDAEDRLKALEQSVATAAPPPSGGSQQQAARPAADEASWNWLKNNGTAEQIRRFIADYPASPRRREAEERLKSLEQSVATTLPARPGGLQFPAGKPVEMTVLFGAGSAADVMARELAKGMEKSLGVPVTVINRVGGGGAIGYSYVQQQKPDGYSIIWNSNSISTAYHLGTTSFDYNAFDAVARVSVETPVLAVRNDAQWQSLKDLVDYAKANPNRMRIGNSGTASHTHFAAAALFGSENAKIINVPFVEGQAVTNLLGSRIEGVVQLPAAVFGQVKSGDLRLLAALGEKRDPVFPDVPTAKELGYPVALDMWRGIAVPAGTPKPVVAKLQDAIKASVESPSFKEAGKTIGFAPAYLPAQDFARLIASDDAQLARLLEAFGLKKK